MKYLFARNSKLHISFTVIVFYSFEDFDEFLPLAINHAIKYGYAIYGNWIFSAYDSLENDL